MSAGPDTGQYVDVAGAPIRVGSSSDNDLVLTDTTVSRRHCEIELTTKGLRIRDSGSTNGVVVAGLRAYDALVPQSARIRVGDTELTASPLADTVERQQASTDRFGSLLGRAARMRELFATLEQVADSNFTLLIEGETGTGKDVVAESVHRESARRDGPFVVFDCGSVAPNLAESELFGHERGAFTGAVAARAGVFEQADGGTLFLDEIGELPKELQPKLLRVLEKREVKRVGGNRTVCVDVRVIAATNRNLRSEISQGNFREDLFFRLAAAHVVVPPLRDRLEDLPLLVAHFLGADAPEQNEKDIPPAIWEMLRLHRWPGNVRELRNAVQRLALGLQGPVLLGAGSATDGSIAAGFERPGGGFVCLRDARREAGDAFEEAYVRAVLAKTGGNVTRAAGVADISRQMMQRLMRKHGLGEGR